MNGPILHPDPPDIRSNAAPIHQGRSLEQFFCIEIFAGSGKLTAALRSLGLRDSFGVDLKLPDHLRSPIIRYDLMKPDHVKLVQDLIASPFCIYLPFAPPCVFRGSLAASKPASRRQMSCIKLPVILLNFACYIKSTFQSKTPADPSCGSPGRL